MRRVFSSLTALAGMSVTGLMTTQPASAQEEFHEIVVTTGFRPETLADNIGSTTVIDASIAEARGAEHLEAVLAAAGNLTLTSGASRGRFVQIRGIGDLEQFVDPKHFPSVGVSLDGIDLGGIANAAMLFDIEQIEILRGPQGTRYGASALAGQVDISTVAPSQQTEAYLEAGFGDYGSTHVGVAAGGGLTDTLAGRIAVRHHEGDGYIENRFLMRDDTNGYDESTLRGRLNFTPRDGAEYDLTAIVFDSDNGYDAFSFANNRQTLSDEPGRDALSLAALGLRGRWEIAANSTLEAKLAWLDSDLDYGYDEDWSNPAYCAATACPYGDFSNTDQYRRRRDEGSLDLRWLGDRGPASDRGLSFVLGVYLQDRTESLLRQYYGAFSSKYSTDRSALYGQLKLALAERLELTAGFRYEVFDEQYSDSIGAHRQSDDEFRSGELALRYRLTDDSAVYGLMSRASKPGGVNTEASGVYGSLEARFRQFLDSRLVFSDEQLTNIELGYKTRLLDGRLDLRVAVFDTTRDDAQLESWFLQYDPFRWVGILDNADASVQGAELELDYSLSANWRIRASAGLLGTEIESITTFDLDTDSFVLQSGVDQARSPSWQIYLGSEWMAGAHWIVAMDVDARDEQRYGNYHSGLIDRMTRVNASVRRVIGGAEVSLWVRNLLDEDYAVHGLYFGNDPGNGYLPERYLQRGEPRLAGVSIRLSF